MPNSWPSEEQVREIGAVSRLNLCPKPPHLNVYDIVEIVNNEKQLRVISLEGKRAILLAWHIDMCMWTVRLLKATDTRDSIIEQEKKQTPTAPGTYYTLPTCHLKLLSDRTPKKRLRPSRTRAPSVERQPPAVRAETRTFPFTISGRLWQVEYPDDKVVFGAMILRAIETDSLHTWKRGEYEIEERIHTEVDVEDDTSELGDEQLLKRPHLGIHTPSGKQLAKRAERSKVIPPEIAAYTTPVRGKEGTYSVSAQQFEAAAQSGMFNEISLEDIDLKIRNGMFIRKSMDEAIGALVANAKRYEQEGKIHLATQQISLAIRAYGNVDDVPPDLYHTRSRYWSALSSDEHNRDTRQRYNTYAKADMQRSDAARFS